MKAENVVDSIDKEKEEGYIGYSSKKEERDATDREHIKPPAR